MLNGLHKSNLAYKQIHDVWWDWELRTPFLNKEVIDFGLRIPTKYRDENFEKEKTSNTKHLNILMEM